jgi:hypothetical protein
MFRYPHLKMGAIHIIVFGIVQIPPFKNGAIHLIVFGIFQIPPFKNEGQFILS